MHLITFTIIHKIHLSNFITFILQGQWEGLPVTEITKPLPVPERFCESVRHPTKKPLWLAASLRDWDPVSSVVAMSRYLSATINAFTWLKLRYQSDVIIEQTLKSIEKLNLKWYLEYICDKVKAYCIHIIEWNVLPLVFGALLNIIQ